MSKDSGYLVKTKTGKKGRTFHRERQINKKMVVHLIDDENNQILDSKGRELKMLCDPKTIEIIGYVD